MLQIQTAIDQESHQNQQLKPLRICIHEKRSQINMSDNTPQSNDYSDISENEYSNPEGTSSESSESESNVTGSKRKKRKTMQKHNTQTTLADGSAAKKSRSENDFDTVSNLIKSSIAQGLQLLKQENDDYIEKIGNLRKNLIKVIDEKAALDKKNAVLIDEKEALKALLAEAEDAKRNQKEMFDEAKKEFMEDIAALETANRNEKKKSDDEKKTLEQKVAALDQNKAKAMCGHCQKVLNTVLFCNDDCL